METLIEVHRDWENFKLENPEMFWEDEQLPYNSRSS